MIGSYALSHLKSANAEQALALLREFFGQDYYGANEKYFRWQYFDSPFKTSMVRPDEYSVLTYVDADQKILALDAFLPWKIFVNGQETSAVWDIEWINFSKIKGLGRELVKELRQRTSIYCGYGMNTLSLEAFKKMGYSTDNLLERKIAILDARKCLALFGREQVKGQQEFLMELEGRCDPKKKDYTVLSQIDNISENYWLEHLKRFPVTSIKNIEALRWRYIQHPFIKVSLITMDPDANRGLAVVRLEKIRGHNEKVLRILELFPVFGEERALIDAVVQFGKDNGAILADFFCVSQKVVHEICPEPFISLAEHNAYDIPMLFQPIEIRERKTINMVLDVDDPFKTMSLDGFYATKGDGDQDVYVNEDYKTVSL